MDGQQTYENMVNITNHQGIANENHKETTFHTCYNGYYENKTNDKCWQRCGEKYLMHH